MLSLRRPAAWLVERARNPETSLWLVISFAVCHALLWTFVLINLKAAQDVHMDVAEAYAWGQKFLLGYGKHPPLSGWIAGLWFKVFPPTDWATYALAMATVSVGMVICWLIALRVVDARGLPLTIYQSMARNVARAVDFLPLFYGVGAVASLVTATGGRLGDLIAGTIVIAMPRQRLLGDLVETTARFTFTDRQLQAYGTLELQVLEELLRRPDAPETPTLLRDVCDRICRKIDYKEAVPDAEIVVFLRDFYTAQRAYLEREQLFGRRRADKHQTVARRK